jgi:hypothetical protein
MEQKYNQCAMSEKASKRDEENKNEGSKTAADQQIHEPIYDFTKPESDAKAVGPRDRKKGSSIMVNDYPTEFAAKENNTSTKNDDDEAKLRTTSDKEC